MLKQISVATDYVPKISKALLGPTRVAIAGMTGITLGTSGGASEVAFVAGLAGLLRDAPEVGREGSMPPYLRLNGEGERSGRMLRDVAAVVSGSQPASPSATGSPASAPLVWLLAVSDFLVFLPFFCGFLVWLVSSSSS